MIKLWAIWGDDHDHDSGSDWVVGVYAVEADADADCAVLEAILKKYRAAAQRPNARVDDEEFRRLITRIDPNGGCDLDNVSYAVGVLVDNNVRMAPIGPEPEEETIAFHKAKNAEIRAKLTEDARIDLLAFYRDKPFRGMMVDGDVSKDRSDGINILIQNKLLLFPTRSNPYALTALGKTIAAEVVKENKAV